MTAANLALSLLLLILSSEQSHAFTCVPRNCNRRTDNNCVCLLPQHPPSTARWSPKQRLQARISGSSFDNDKSGTDEDISSTDLKKRLAKVKDSEDSLQLEKLPTEEQEYKAKLAEAEKAIAEAEAARQKL